MKAVLDPCYKTAVHEAGHAVVGQEVGYAVHEVSVRNVGGKETGYKLNGVAFRSDAWRGVCDAETESRGDTLAGLKRELAFVLAGRIAVALAEGQEVDHFAGIRRVFEERGGRFLVDTLGLEERSSGRGFDDYRKAAAALLDGDERAGSRWIAEALPAAAGEAVRMLRERWQDVESLARRLEADGRVVPAPTRRAKATTKARGSERLSPRLTAIRDHVRRGEAGMKYASNREVR